MLGDGCSDLADRHGAVRFEDVGLVGDGAFEHLADAGGLLLVCRADAFGLYVEVDDPPIPDLAHDLLRDDDFINVAGVGDDDMAPLAVGGLREVEDEHILVHGAGEATHGDERVAVGRLEAFLMEIDATKPQLAGVVVSGVLEGVGEGDAGDVNAVAGHPFGEGVLPAAGVPGE